MVQTIPNNNSQVMTPRDFCMWLHGFFEISGANTLDLEQVKMVQAHLNLMFKQPMVSFVSAQGGQSAGNVTITSSLEPDNFIC